MNPTLATVATPNYPAGIWKADPVHSEIGPNGSQRVGFSATAQINRTDFGIDRWAGGGAVIGDKVPVSLRIEAVLQQ